MSALRYPLILGSVLTLGLVTGLSANAADEPANIVDYRKSTMRAIGGHMANLGAIAKGEVSFTDDAFGAAHAIHQMSMNLARLFPEGTGQGETGEESRSLPAIWEKPDEFQAAIEALQEESLKLAELTESGEFEQAAFARQVGMMGKEGCSTCHDGFRAENN